MLQLAELESKVTAAFDDLVHDFCRAEVNEYDSVLLGHAGTRTKAEALVREISCRFRSNADAGMKGQRHNNGFLRLLVFRHPASQASIRLHIWRSELAHQIDPVIRIHDHRWDFASIGIAGRLRFRNYEAHEDLRGEFDAWHLADADLNGAKQSSHHSRCSAVQTCMYEIQQGLLHHLKHNQLHRTDIPSQYAATLVLTAPAARPYSRVLRPTEESTQAAGKTPRSLGADELTCALDEMSDMLRRG
jgi:hypothetical protein